MIELRQVSKAFSGSTRYAVDRLTLAVPGGRTCVLVGPSGCGKSTTLKMINRLIEPTTGRILRRGRGRDAGRPGRAAAADRLRHPADRPVPAPDDRRRTSAPCRGCSAGRKAKIKDRVEELLDLVGLDPAEYADRYPHQLSGGQRQRVGVARALAADPPVLLMDEPFGAVDPVVRARLQDEFLASSAGCGKTVVFVTHDIDEAVRMGDRVAVMRRGPPRPVRPAGPAPRRARRTTSSPTSSAPTAALKRLALITAGAAAEPGPASEGAPTIGEEASLRDVLALLLAQNADAARVVDAAGRPKGALTLAAIRRAAAAPAVNDAADEAAAGPRAACTAPAAPPSWPA